MSISKSLARLTPIAAACCAVFAAVPASAAVVASFDPAYNISPGNPDSDMNNIGYKGTITLDLTGCSSSSGYTYTSNGNHYPYGSCAISVESAHIDFYNSTTNPVTQSPILQSIDLPGSFFDSSYVYGAYFDSTGHLASFDTEYSDFFSPTIYDGGAAPISYNYGSTTDALQLYFVSGQEPPPPPPPPCDDDDGCFQPSFTASFVSNANGFDPNAFGGFLTNTQLDENGDPEYQTSTYSQPATVTILPDTTAVPEPESLALTLLGFAALLFSRRRKASGHRADQAGASRPPISAA